MEGVASSPAQIKLEALESATLGPGLLAAPAIAHLLTAFNSQPPHRFDAEQAVERNTVTGAFPPAAAVRRISNLLARSFLSAGLFAQVSRPQAGTAPKSGHLPGSRSFVVPKGWWMEQLWPWGQQRRACLAPRLLCQGLNWALCVLINLQARVTVLAVLAFQNAKSKRQLRGKRKLILFSGLNCFSG